MSNPDQLRAEIDRTRAQMSEDVNALTDYVAPANVAHRQADKVRGAVGGAVTNVKEKVMGQASNVSASASDTASSLSDARSSASDAAHAAPGKVAAGTRGNPLAAGLIALGAGWLLASLLPASEKETQAAAAVKENASSLAKPLTDAAKDAASNLKDPAMAAVQTVKDTATDAAGTVKDEGSAAAQHVQGRAADAKESVQSTRS